MDNETSRRMEYEFNRKLERQSSYYEYIMSVAETDKIGAAYMLCTGLMRGNRDTLQLGYSLGAALSATLGQINLTDGEIGALVERIAVPREGIVDYGPKG